MKALTVAPMRIGSVRVEEIDPPVPGENELLVDGVALGVCGTDREIVDGEYGAAPPGHDRLVLGHESLGRVRQAPPGSGFSPGDLVVGIVRRPDPSPCGPCGHGEFDMCRNGGFTERGIKELHGYGAEQWTVEPGYAVRLDPALERVGVLMEPTTIVAKAWEQIERIGRRAWFEPRTVLVTGAGPIGLLAALLGVRRGLDVHVLDRVDTGAKPGLVTALGATYHTGSIADLAREVPLDIIVETTGASDVILDAMVHNAAVGIVCFVGLGGGGRVELDADVMGRRLVLENDVLFGSVNANRRHYEQAALALSGTDPSWLERMITRRVPLADAAGVFTAPSGEEVKVVIDL
ncbi:glucose 1-dehydrogenase [Nocardiopsis lambiniae]|uniref:Glucose 1-dehydrogenase n=1 Tax=Nocardiopsis lambiniae TaxID=3075539 RepID=A0ABU2M6X7_9ACTN|nr:glucose 1-dehydrogenase [Nocardiopsis sp. DSM 44743]MDT0328427.1 glucose 1-dehydrogenase [Nocardiopsis sp. DSM 44743]